MQLMLHQYDDQRFQQIIDEFILSSTNDKQISDTIKNIDHEAAKLGISFYQLMFLLIQKDVFENHRRQRKKKWLSKNLW